MKKLKYKVGDQLFEDLGAADLYSNISGFKLEVIDEIVEQLKIEEPTLDNEPDKVINKIKKTK